MPKVTITDKQRKQIRQLAALGLSDSDIATVVDLARVTMERRCRAELERGRAEMRQRLHRIQWTMAAKSAAMAIWLGKQYLGQRDIPLAPEAEGAVIEYVHRIVTSVEAPHLHGQGEGGASRAGIPAPVHREQGS